MALLTRFATLNGRQTRGRIGGNGLVCKGFGVSTQTQIKADIPSRPRYEYLKQILRETLEPLKLSIVSEDGIEATIYSDGSQDGANDYYAIVSVKGFVEDVKIYGTDPIQSFSLGLNFIATLTEDRRLEDGPEKTVKGARWSIGCYES